MFDYSDSPMTRPLEEIRLLHLKPGVDEAEIEVQLRVYDFETCPQYVAISYTWGDKIPTLVIKVNGQPFRVQVNCWYTLWQMRHHKQHSDFWLDSICINQSNIEEKNAQVATMGEIYSRAILTASCFGPGNSLSAAHKLVTSTRYGTVSAALEKERNALKTFQQHPYWRRIWIKQEILLSKEVRLFCGTDYLDWPAYEEILGFVAKYDVQQKGNSVGRHPNARSFTEDVHMALVRARQVKTPFGGKEMELSPFPPWTDLWGLLETYGNSECHDPHDKIYAILPLLHKKSRMKLGLEIDYRLPTFSLALEAIHGYLREFSATLMPGTTHATVPVAFWRVMTNMIQHGLDLQLSDPAVATFLCQCVSLCKTAQNLNPSDRLGTLIGTPEYIPSQIMYRISISHQINPETFLNDWHEFMVRRGREEREILASNDPEDVVNYDGYLVPRRISEIDPIWISETILVKEVHDYFYRIWNLDPDDHEGIRNPAFPSATGDFTLSGLSPNLEVKLVVTASKNTGAGFLVPPNIEVGDKLVCCRLVDSHRRREFMPVMRPCADDSNYALLAGWALSLGNDGSLRDQPLFDSDALPLYDNLDGRIKPREPLPEKVAKGPLFNLHYEDLIMYALRLQDAAAYLTYPCTHREHPSFFSGLLPRLEEPGKIEAMRNKMKNVRFAHPSEVRPILRAPARLLTG